MQPYTLNLRTVPGTGGFAVTWFVAIFENLRNSLSEIACRTWFALFGNSQRVVGRQYFCQATQNGARTAIVFARQSKPSGF